MFLRDRTALVTGGGRGIGRAIAERLAEAGERVVVTGLTTTEIEETAAALGGVAVPMDLASRPSIASGLQTIAERVGRIDVLINNAGLAESATYDRTSDELWDRLLAVNATAPFALCRALIPPMVAAGWGRVVNIASNAGLIGYAYTMAYCASKHALVGMTRAIAHEIARTPVTINCVCPGWVETRMADEAIARIAQKTGRPEGDARRALEAVSPQRRLFAPDEVAHLVLALCGDGARGIHGQAIPLDGGQVMS